jgi:hypothetical protein
MRLTYIHQTKCNVTKLLVVVQQLLVVMPGLLLHLRQLLRPFFKPGDDIREDGVDVVGRLAGGEGVPHARVELERLVLARRRPVQQLAHRWVRYLVRPAVHNQEWQRHLHTHSTHLILIEIN